MNRNDFIAKANEWMRGATGGALGFSDNDLFIIEHEEAPGDFIFENEDFVVGKYFFRLCQLLTITAKPCRPIFHIKNCEIPTVALIFI